MHTLVLESPDREALRDAAARMWKEFNITGEMGLTSDGNGGWRLEVFSERQMDEGIVKEFGVLTASR